MHCLIKFVLLMVLLMIPAGCWSRNEVEDLAIASAIGIDKIKQGGENKIQFSVLVLRPERAGGGETGGMGGGSAGGVLGWINFGEGNSVNDAERNLSTTTSHRLFLGHSRVIVLGEKTVRDGVGDIIDYLARNKDIRLRNWVLVSKSSALETFQLQPELENLFSDEVNNLLALSVPRVSKSFAVDLKDFLVDLSSPGKEAVLPLLETRIVPGSMSPDAQQSGQPQPHKNARLKGLAVFKEDKMVGELEDTETKGFLLVMGKAKTGMLTFQVKNSGTKKLTQVTVEMTRTNSKIQTEVIDGKPVITVEIDAEGNLAEFSEPKASTKPEDIEYINKGYAAQIKKQAEMVIHKCQKKLQSDIFGFGTVFHRQQVEYWKEQELEKNWAKVFPEVPVKVEVKANIRRTGLTSDSISIE